MILQARDIGELAAAQMQSASEGKVTRVFRRSAYVETKEGLILLLEGELRSPMTLNLGAEAGLEQLVSVGGSCSLGAEKMSFEGFSVERGDASVYRSALLDRSPVDVVDSGELVKGVVMLSLLYDVSPPSLNLVGDAAFAKFIRSVVLSFGRGETREPYLPESYFPLVGLGSGFTPAGDDLLSGYLATFNFAARSLGIREILLPWSDLEKRTVAESARMLEYAQRGHTDEDLTRLILSAVSSHHASFESNLLDVARRGHTSGIDMSLGVILASASVAGWLGRSDATQKIVDALSRLRTL
jgi:hypothetical protein